MPTDNLDPFTYNDIAKDREEGKGCRKRSLAVDDEERHIVDFQSIGEVSHTCSTGVRVSNDYDFMPTINEFLDKVSSGLMEEWGQLQWTIGTCDSLHLLNYMRKRSLSFRRDSYQVVDRSCR